MAISAAKSVKFHKGVAGLPLYWGWGTLLSAAFFHALALIIGIGLEGVTKIQRGGGVNFLYSDNILLVDPSISETDLTLF